MVPFSEVILKAISDYKLLLRKIYSTREATAKIKGLGLKRTQLREVDDVQLYNIALIMINNLEGYVSSHGSKSNGSYFGAEEFLRYLKNFLSVYTIEGNKVIHTAREAARAVVEAIQLVTLPEKEITKEIFSRLSRCIDMVNRHGNIEHIAILNDAIKRNKKGILSYLNRYNIALKIEELFAKAGGN